MASSKAKTKCNLINFFTNIVVYKCKGILTARKTVSARAKMSALGKAE